MSKVILNIKNIRRQKGISQESLAYDLGIDYSTYGKIERGQISLTVDRLEKIALILNVSVGEIYQWKDESPKVEVENGGTETVLRDIANRLNKCLSELENYQKELSLLREQLNDKEKIIKLLEKKTSEEK